MSRSSFLWNFAWVFGRFPKNGRDYFCEFLVHLMAEEHQRFYKHLHTMEFTRNGTLQKWHCGPETCTPRHRLDASRFLYSNFQSQLARQKWFPLKVLQNRSKKRLILCNYFQIFLIYFLPSDRKFSRQASVFVLFIHQMGSTFDPRHRNNWH